MARHCYRAKCSVCKRFSKDEYRTNFSRLLWATLAGSMDSLLIQAGPRALAHLRQHGLRAADIAVIPAAAGGPKGLIFQHLDQWLFGDWLLQAPRERDLIGSSIGAWRMAAACHADPVAAFARLSDLYCEEQRYARHPSAAQVTRVISTVLDKLVGGHEEEVVQHPQHRLHVVVARGLRMLASPGKPSAEKAGFAVAALANALSRRWLSHHLQRVVMHDARSSAQWLLEPFDEFATQGETLDAGNLQAALLASGTLPFVMEPVRHLPGAPAGTYWDGGLVDYHLALPYHRLESGLVLYPHFGAQIVPGWMDKHLPWRHAARSPRRHWLDNMVLVSPSPAFLARLPLGRLPDRRDFPHYDLEHDRRIADWRRAIGEGERLRDELASFAARADLSKVRPL
jgi:hypothetical protein